MRFLPVVERELRVTARRGNTYWTRFLAALGALVICVWIWGWLTEGQLPHARGLMLFRFTAGLAFLSAIRAGATVTSDCLSEEKREGTLGLMFLTNLKSYDVVLGKLAARSVNALYRLFSVFPILAVPLLMGALTLGEFWRMALVLTNTLFFSLAAGILISALSRQERRALLGTLLLILVITAGPPLLGLINWHNRTLPYNEQWLLSSAVYPWWLSFDAGFKVKPTMFWAACITTHVCGWAQLVGACLAVRNSWRDRPAVGQAALRRDRWRAWQFGHGAAGLAYRRRLLQVNPILWLVARDRLRQISVWAMLGVVGLLWVWFYDKQGSAALDTSLYLLTAYGLHTIIKLWLASEACRPLAEERRSGTLEVLLSTPLAVDEILEGQILALQRQFGWSVALVLVADAIMMFAGMRDQVWESSNDWVVLFLALMIMFVLDLYTLAWVGLWLSLHGKKPTRVWAGTVGRVLVLPWAVFVLGLSVLSTMPSSNQAIDFGELGLLLTGLAIAVLNDAIFFTWARTNVREQFRTVATERFQARTEPDLVANPPPTEVEIPPALAQ
jgi:ABC-type transport system involved in cytochrome c biogenesis permease component